jgi:hypothetical protein
MLRCRAFKDMLMSMRFRSNWMKNSCPDRAKQMNWNTITSCLGEDGVAELGNILRDASTVC